eukprot:CAMPEP_0113323794 /NCGR_PEP_ID=MMETSP0010_2-20120614/16567_1 /TAXON_ID=216773 ORGANISM="Corethron hystrix, Strain 308" /NCGR_SAMPLE_ID=MMETSP0010_2 /ASSEMBLY_ACC=CAM_ASM_000155 /LENGTH=253 /DNA_ID=CAMNT_0000182861 /DNA_START=147 /DNA_END=908 /DNA_ORIENTATION=+ /assembly_acc=CAM_ASM_000155
MARFALSLLACSVLATGVVGMAIQESSELEPVMDSRLLQASASGSVSGSVSLCGSPGCLLIAELIAAGLFVLGVFEFNLTFFPMLESIFDMLAGLLEAVVEIAVGLGIIVPPARKAGPKSSKMDPELAEYLVIIVEEVSYLIAGFMEAREDPNVGEAFDEQICAAAEVVAEVEGMMGKSLKGRNLKGKSGKGLGIECPEIKSGKSGKSAKTYSPSPTPTTPATSMKSAKSAKSIKAAKSAKAAKAMKSLKSGK